MNLPARYSFGGSDGVDKLSNQDLRKNIPGLIDWHPNAHEQVMFKTASHSMIPSNPTVKPDAKNIAGKNRGYVLAKPMHGYGDDASAPVTVPAPLSANPVVTPAAAAPIVAPTHQLPKVVCVLVSIAIGTVVGYMLCKKHR